MSKQVHKQGRQQKKRFTVQHQQDLQEQLQSGQQEANIERGIAYREKMMLRDENGQPYPLGCDTHELSKYGIGLRLFFDFLKYATIIFYVMALAALPSIISHGTSDGLDQNYSSSSNSFPAITIANQPELFLYEASDSATSDEISEIQTKNEQQIIDFVETMNDRQYWIIIPDIVYSSIFIIFIFAWRYASKRIKKQSIISEAMPSHYTLKIYGLPPNTYNEQDLKEHFQKFGQIEECKMIRDYCGTLFYHKKQAQIDYKLQVEKKKNEIRKKKGQQQNTEKIEKLKEKKQKVAEDINKITNKKFGEVKSHEEYPALGAYLVFNNIKDKIACQEAFDKAHAFCGYKDERCFYKQKLLSATSKVDEPSNIKWENLDAGTLERCGRLSCVFILVLCVMIITFSMIFVANIVKPNNSVVCPSTNISYDEANSSSDADIVTCYCRQQSLQTLQVDDTIYEFCYDTYIEIVSLYIITVAIAFVVIIVNFMLKGLLKALGIFSKYATITKQTIGITFSLFAAMFFNTAFITLLLQADIFGFVPAVIVTKPIPPLSDLQDENASTFSADFDRAWYIEVGGKITFTMLINIISPHLTFLALVPCQRRSRDKKAKKALLQKDMNTYMTGPAYDLTGQYAAIMNTMFVTLFYCSGIPLLLWFAAISLTVQYWVYKYYLLRYKKKPPTYDNKLNKRMIAVLPFAIILHLMVSIYMYGRPLIIPYSSDQITSTAAAGETTVEVQEGSSSINERVQNQLFIFICLIVFAVIVVADKTLLFILKKFYKCLCCKRKKDTMSKISPDGEGKTKMKFGTYREEYAEMSKRLLSSYDIRMNEDYANLVRAIEHGKLFETARASNSGGGSENGKIDIDKEDGILQDNESQRDLNLQEQR